MYYSKRERYSFVVPREYKDFLQFKDQLKEAGVKFTEASEGFFEIITINTGGNFKMGENGYFDLVKQEVNHG